MKQFIDTQFFIELSLAPHFRDNHIFSNGRVQLHVHRFVMKDAGMSGRLSQGAGIGRDK